MSDKELLYIENDKNAILEYNLNVYERYITKLKEENEELVQFNKLLCYYSIAVSILFIFTCFVIVPS